MILITFKSLVHFDCITKVETLTSSEESREIKCTSHKKLFTADHHEKKRQNEKLRNISPTTAHALHYKYA